MQNPFTTQPELFVTSADLEHPSLSGLNGAEAVLERFGIDDQVQCKGYRDHPLSDADVNRNDEIAVTRSGGERLFATY